MDRASIIAEMKLIFTDMPYGVNHTLRVLNNADAIMTGEHVGEKTQEIISLAAILHDIGAAAAQQKLWPRLSFISVVIGQISRLIALCSEYER